MRIKSSNYDFRLVQFVLVFIALLVYSNDLNRLSGTIHIPFSEAEFYKELNECTTGVASGFATPDGRPLLWKCRDVGGADQKFEYNDNIGIPFIGLTYSSDDDEYYAGMNAVGFSIENSDPVNLGGRNPGGNGWGSDADDGEVMAYSLANCRTVDDFQEFMDSTNIDGRTHDSNYGVFDAYGNAAMFETDGYTYTRFDASESPDGFIIRSNFAYSGNGGVEYEGYSRERHDRAFELWKAAVDRNELTPQYCFQQVIRDLKLPGMETYAIPYADNWYNNDRGFIPNSDAICRSTTRAVMVAQGVADNMRPDDGIVWAMTGNSVGGIVTPLWVRAGSNPIETADGRQEPSLCRIARRMQNWIVDNRGVDTYKLRNEAGQGYWDFAYPLESWMFSKVDQFLNSPTFTYDQLEIFQNTMARQIADSMNTWRPKVPATQIVEPVYRDGWVVLAWNDVEDPFGDDRVVANYDIYRSDEPFRDNNTGELVGNSVGCRFVDNEPMHGGTFYRIQATF